FFSSRRRHTTSKRDWSSDVCSSDLHLDEAGGIDVDTFSEVRERSARADLDLCAATVRDLHPADARRLLLLVFLALRTARLAATRSEERRVGDALMRSTWPHYEEAGA